MCIHIYMCIHMCDWVCVHGCYCVWCKGSCLCMCEYMYMYVLFDVLRNLFLKQSDHLTFPRIGKEGFNFSTSLLKLIFCFANSQRSRVTPLCVHGLQFPDDCWVQLSFQVPVLSFTCFWWTCFLPLDWSLVSNLSFGRRACNRDAQTNCSTPKVPTSCAPTP